MKRLAAVLAALAVAGPALAQHDHRATGGMDMKTAKKDAGQAAHKAAGVVTKVDKDKVTIRHEPVASLKWPAMTMGFTVKDKALAERLAKDRKVEFEFVQEGKDYVITSVK